MKKLLLCFSLLSVFSIAQAQLVDIELETFVVHDDFEFIDGVNLDGYTTYRLYAVCESTDDFVSSIFGVFDVITQINTTTDFWQSEFGGLSSESINESALAFVPSLEYDSYVTIGKIFQSDPGTATFTSGTDWSNQFEPGGGIPGSSFVIEGAVGGAWFTVNLGAEESINAFAGDDFKVLIGQFTTTGTMTGCVNVQVFVNGIGDNDVETEICFEACDFIFNASGCTDSTACNFDSAATCDDGSCAYTLDDCGDCGGSGILGCTNSTACNYDSTATCNGGSCLFDDCFGICGGNNVAGCVDPTACNFDSAATCDDGSCAYTLDDCGDCGGSGVLGCTNSTACNYDSTATCDDGSCILPDGCTDSTACNYDLLADCDDGSCVLPDGCTDSTACNYDSAATCDDGSCVLPDGCTNSTACNYNSQAICDNGGCLFLDDCGNCGGSGVLGCTNSTACNYDSAATCDDGSCTVNDDCGDCGGSGVAGCIDPIACNYDSTADCDDELCTYLDNPVIDMTTFNWILMTEVGGSPPAGSWITFFNDDQTWGGENGILGTWSLCSGFFMIEEEEGLPCCINSIYAGSWDGTGFTGTFDNGAGYWGQFWLYPIIPGCVDTTACNYDSTATDADGSCTYSGCTDSTAVNFNPNAGCDDGSCILTLGVYNAPDVELNYGDLLELDIFIEDGLDIYAAYASITFDDNVWTLIEGIPGPFLGEQVLISPPIINGNSIDFGLSKTGPVAGSSGSGLLYTLKFAHTVLPVQIDPYVSLFTSFKYRCLQFSGRNWHT